MDAALLASVKDLAGHGVAQQLAAEQHRLSADDLELLQEAVQQRQASEQQAHMQRAEMERQADEYEAEAQRLQEQLRIIGLPLDKLSPPAREALRTLATIASQLHLAHPSQATMVAAWTDLALKDMRAAVMQSKVEQQCGALTRALGRAEIGASRTRAAMAEAAAAQAADEANHEAMRVRLIDFHNKIDAYKAKEAAMSHALARKGLKPELKHHALVEAAQQYEELQLQLQQAQAELAEFHGLPASQVGAELRLRQLEERCIEAKAQLQRGMRDLN
uniref:Uncharacterized protein n=1 Tax=Dunaliella tertiolecta TaxID=3047 RepID=A0A7S3QRB1_DUNTE|mmetsp:Transcript_5483/g.14815  ORF Transcript_5483/g.14815 Transcript_5483/m.14815 type:complete len:276 (-) Transcript_5483:362-1189(-)|eukprot:CAMPEP_0202343184 /NCGR_PEP_ID=MMETSP1126-20121109/3418_1 /ASSEMBLY_ACC=CAM_ASM_000457 /TAXON_ID=3047 /ORGANISM="Dunaliella tertiolecta, Strain CCMP1320" /LENGTH=275 /DNA_ID=CAMNT_0048934225 /DNA_START=55 /DNA_END=882 /DNA_ORIENTATION=-